MRHISDGVYRLLMGQGLRAGSVGADRAGAGKGPGKMPGQFTGEERQNCSGEIWNGFDYRVHTNPAMSNMPMRKTAKRRTSAAFLMVIEGGRQ